MNIRCITVDVLQSLVQGSLTVSGAASCARTPAFLSVASWWSAMKRDRIRFVDCIVSWNFSLSHILFENTYVAGSKRSCLQNDIQFKMPYLRYRMGPAYLIFGGWCQESTEEQGTLMVGFGQPGPPFPGPVHLCAGVWIASWLVVHLRRSLVRTHWWYPWGR